jgi:hypothetical protein
MYDICGRYLILLFRLQFTSKNYFLKDYIINTFFSPYGLDKLTVFKQCPKYEFQRKDNNNIFTIVLNHLNSS